MNIKNIIGIALTIITISCSKDIIPLNNEDKENNKLNHNLIQKHFVTWHLIDHYFGFGTQMQQHKITDINLAWLEFSNGTCSDTIEFKVTFIPQHTKKINCQNPENLIGCTIPYNNGFKFENDTIYCCFTENCDSISFNVGEKTIKFPPSELKYSAISPSKLFVENVENRKIHSVVSVTIHHNNNIINFNGISVPSTETMDIPLIITY